MEVLFYKYFSERVCRCQITGTCLYLTAAAGDEIH